MSFPEEVPQAVPDNFMKSINFCDQGQKKFEDRKKSRSTVGRGSDHRFEADHHSGKSFQKIPSENHGGPQGCWAGGASARGYCSGPAAAEDFLQALSQDSTFFRKRRRRPAPRLKMSFKPRSESFIALDPWANRGFITSSFIPGS